MHGTQRIPLNIHPTDKILSHLFYPFTFCMLITVQFLITISVPFILALVTLKIVLNRICFHSSVLFISNGMITVMYVHHRSLHGILIRFKTKYQIIVMILLAG